MAAAPPPTKPAKPGTVEVYKASFDYDARTPEELTFKAGQVLYVQSKSEDGWWTAVIEDKIGLIPGNYMEASAVEVKQPLHEAAKRGNEALLLEGIEAKVSKNGLDKAGCCPLHYACKGDHVGCVQILVEKGAYLDVQDKIGDTPLHKAAWRGSAGAAELLVRAGARTDIKNNEGERAIDLAKTPEVAAIIESGTGVTNADADDYLAAEESDDDEQ
eukprot:Clim_evm35s77 gene=Clim_evmTU35s77